MAMHATAILNHVVHSFADIDSGICDRELLYRFVHAKDQSAFAALVHRHTAMVYGVCRRALSHPHDAEDACQAAFVILAQKAKSERWQSSIANWLYTTARKVARNALVSAQRRRRQERRAAVPEAVPAMDTMTGRELLAILDQELDKLPPRYREPLVLCYLEGLTRDEAAARLGIGAGTVKIQLERGRKRLGDALTKRGCGMGLLALAAASAAEASPPHLVNAVITAVKGLPSAAVAAFAKGAAVNGVLNKSVLASLAAAIVVALGIGLGVMSVRAGCEPPVKPVPVEPGKAKAKEPQPAPEPAKEPPTLGRVLGPDGKPHAGAKLLILGKAAPLGTTDRDGRFAITLPKERAGIYLVARAEGFGIDFIELGQGDPKAEVELRLSAEMPIRGRIIDTEGKPVIGAWVRMDRLGAFPNNALDASLAEWKTDNLSKGGLRPSGTKNIWSGTSALFTTTTDKEGRFEFRGVGADQLATLRLGATGFTESEVYVVARKGFDPKPFNEASAKSMSPFQALATPTLLHGPEFGIVAEREKLIRGRVIAADTDKGRPNIHVILSRSGGALLTVLRDAWTDADGRFEIHGARKASSYMIEVFGEPETGHMASQATAADTLGYDPITLDVTVKKGIVITGCILDKSTGKPVTGFVMVGVMIDNPFVKDYPQFTSSAWMGGVDTAADGTFRVVTIPGPVLLMGGPNSFEVMAKYKRPVADPKYPKYFQTFGDHTAFNGPGGIIMPLQGNFAKVMELKPDVAVVKEDILFEPVK